MEGSKNSETNQMEPMEQDKIQGSNNSAIIQTEQDEVIQNPDVLANSNFFTKNQNDLKEAIEKFVEIRLKIHSSTEEFVKAQCEYMKERKERRKSVSNLVKQLHRELFPDISKYTAEHGYFVADWIYENCLGMRRNSDGTFDRTYWQVNALGRRLTERSFSDEFKSIGDEILDIIRNAIKTMNAQATEVTSTTQVTFGEPLEEQFGESFEESSRKSLGSIILCESWKLETLIEAALNCHNMYDGETQEASKLHSIEENSKLASKTKEDEEVCLGVFKLLL
jgi:hypothetical protein